MLVKVYRYRVLPEKLSAFLRVQERAAAVYESLQLEKTSYLRCSEDPYVWIEVHRFADALSAQAQLQQLSGHAELARLWREFQATLDPRYPTTVEEFTEQRFGASPAMPDTPTVSSTPPRAQTAGTSAKGRPAVSHPQTDPVIVTPPPAAEPILMPAPAPRPAAETTLAEPEPAAAQSPPEPSAAESTADVLAWPSESLSVEPSCELPADADDDLDADMDDRMAVERPLELTEGAAAPEGAAASPIEASPAQPLADDEDLANLEPTEDLIELPNEATIETTKETTAEATAEPVEFADSPPETDEPAAAGELLLASTDEPADERTDNLWTEAPGAAIAPSTDEDELARNEDGQMPGAWGDETLVSDDGSVREPSDEGAPRPAAPNIDLEYSIPLVDEMPRGAPRDVPRDLSAQQHTPPPVGSASHPADIEPPRSVRVEVLSASDVPHAIRWEYDELPPALPSPPVPTQPAPPREPLYETFAVDLPPGMELLTAAEYELRQRRAESRPDGSR